MLFKKYIYIHVYIYTYSDFVYAGIFINFSHFRFDESLFIKISFATNINNMCRIEKHIQKNNVIKKKSKVSRGVGVFSKVFYGWKARMGDVSIATKSRMGDSRSVYAFQSVESDGTCTSGFKKRKGKKKRIHLVKDGILIKAITWFLVELQGTFPAKKQKPSRQKKATFAMIIVQRS